MSFVFRGNFENIKVGTSAIISSAEEVVSCLKTVSANTASTGFTFSLLSNLEGAMSNSQTGSLFRTSRTIVASQTDTAAFTAMQVGNDFTVPSAQTYTNTNSSGFTGLLMLAPPAISGSYAITRYNKIRFANDTASTGTRKISIAFGTLSGATNNAQIADNAAFSGNYFISQTGTDPSSFGGQVRAASLGVGNSATATGSVGSLAKKIEVFDASGASLGFIPVYASIS